MFITHPPNWQTCVLQGLRPPLLHQNAPPISCPSQLAPRFFSPDQGSPRWNQPFIGDIAVETSSDIRAISDQRKPSFFPCFCLIAQSCDDPLIDLVGPLAIRRSRGRRGPVKNEPPRSTVSTPTVLHRMGSAQRKKPVAPAARHNSLCGVGPSAQQADTTSPAGGL